MVTFKAEWVKSYYCPKCKKMCFVLELDYNPEYCPTCGWKSPVEKADRIILNPINWWYLDLSVGDDFRFQQVIPKERRQVCPTVLSLAIM